MHSFRLIIFNGVLSTVNDRFRTVEMKANDAASNDAMPGDLVDGRRLPSAIGLSPAGCSEYVGPTW